jgi:hypothetical protein
MAITATPSVLRLINKERMEIVMSVEIDDGDGDVRTLTETGKAKDKTERERLMDGIVARYNNERAKESDLVVVKGEMETDAKAYLEDQLNG